jgi:septum formation protein
MRTPEPEICLASSSPRRRQLLEQIGIGFHVVAVGVDESPRPREAPAVYTERLALAKARTGRESAPLASRLPVLGADTAVVVDDLILGKPTSRDDAVAMLVSLAGREHRVLSAVALVAGSREAVRLNVTTVTFRPIGAEEAAAYWATGEPRDKAGGYAIQGYGAVFVAHLAGSYSGVMGLPLYETAELLRDFGVGVGAG